MEYIFLQLKTANDVVKQVLGHMTSSDNPSHIAVNNGWMHSTSFSHFWFDLWLYLLRHCYFWSWIASFFIYVLAGFWCEFSNDGFVAHYKTALVVLWKVKSEVFPSHMNHRTALIFVSLALIQTQAYRLRNHGYRASASHLVPVYSSHSGWPGWVDLTGWFQTVLTKCDYEDRGLEIDVLKCIILRLSLN